jgi:pimeloyl-ACP methyl ester carboxylesterase
MMKLLLAIVAALCLYLLVLFLMQDSLILRPGLAARLDAGTISSDVYELREDGQYRGLVYDPVGAPKGTILIFHGNASLAQGLDVITEPFLERGVRVVLQEYPGYGQRAGKATVRNALASALEDFKVVRDKWDGPVYVAGHSFGAGIAAQVAGAFPESVAGVVLFTPWNSLASLVNESFFGIPFGLLLRNKLDSALALQRYQGPVVIISAEKDLIVPTSHSRALAARLPSALYMEIQDANHISWLFQKMPEAYARIFNALRLPQESADKRLAP